MAWLDAAHGVAVADGDQNDLFPPSAPPALKARLSPPDAPARRRYKWGAGGSQEIDPELHQTLLRMAAREIPLATMAAVVERSQVVVKRWLRSREQRRAISKLKAEQVLAEADNHFELWGMLPEVRAAILDALEKRGRVGLDAAKYVHDALVQKPATRLEVGIAGKIEHDLSPVIAQIGEALSRIAERNAGRDPLARVKVGMEALGRPQLGSGAEADAE